MKERRVVGDTGRSKILVGDRGIQVYTGSKSLNPIGVVTVIPGIQLEIGRDIREFIGCIKMVRQPLAYQKIADSNGLATWSILRLATGKIPEVVICNINTVNYTMLSITFNQHLVYDKVYRRYQQLGSIHQLRIGKSDETKLLSNAVMAVSTLTLVPTSKLNIKANSKVITVYTSDKSLTEQIRYTFSKDKEGYFNLLSVGIMPKKIK